MSLSKGGVSGTQTDPVGGCLGCHGLARGLGIAATPHMTSPLDPPLDRHCIFLRDREGVRVAVRGCDPGLWLQGTESPGWGHRARPGLTGAWGRSAPAACPTGHCAAQQGVLAHGQWAAPWGVPIPVPQRCLAVLSGWGAGVDRQRPGLSLCGRWAVGVGRCGGPGPSSHDPSRSQWPSVSSSTRAGASRTASACAWWRRPSGPGCSSPGTRSSSPRPGTQVRAGTAGCPGRGPRWRGWRPPPQSALHGARVQPCVPALRGLTPGSRGPDGVFEEPGGHRLRRRQRPLYIYLLTVWGPGRPSCGPLGTRVDTVFSLCPHTVVPLCVCVLITDD